MRNRCPETGNEEYLVAAAKFPARYGEAQSKPDAAGYRAFVPKGTDMGYFIVSPAEGEFSFTAPWGEAMVARPGDAIVQSPGDAADTYRIAAPPRSPAPTRSSRRPRPPDTRAYFCVTVVCFDPCQAQRTSDQALPPVAMPSR